MDDILRVEASPLERDLLNPSAYDAWLADIRQRVALAAANYDPHEISNAQEYKDAKANRAEARRIARDIDAERKRMTRVLTDTVTRIRSDTKDLLVPLTAADEAYRQEIAEWDQKMTDAKLAELERSYREAAEQLVDLVPFVRILERYGDALKWRNRSKGMTECRRELYDVLQDIAADEAEIDALPCSPEERREVKADYFTCLDLDAALGRMGERRRQRERVAALEDERAAMGRVPAVQEHERERIVVYEVTVPASKVHEFRAAMMAIEGVHGHKVGER